MNEKGSEMKNIFAVFLIVAVALLTLGSHGKAAVELDVTKTLNIETTPLDVAVSLDGRWVFVLTDQGSLLIYSLEGELEDEVPVGKHVDDIEVGPEPDRLFLRSQKNKTVQILLLEFIQNFDNTDSPFKGRVDAPVEIAVFGDFQ